MSSDISMLREIMKLREFKEYVHKRLDDAGVPANPDPVGNEEHGCRIEGRLNHILTRMNRAERLVTEYETECWPAGTLNELIQLRDERAAFAQTVISAVMSANENRGLYGHLTRCPKCGVYEGGPHLQRMHE